jgi:hypothetical protein
MTATDLRVQLHAVNPRTLWPVVEIQQYEGRIATLWYVYEICSYLLSILLYTAFIFGLYPPATAVIVAITAALLFYPVNKRFWRWLDMHFDLRRLLLRCLPGGRECLFIEEMAIPGICRNAFHAMLALEGQSGFLCNLAGYETYFAGSSQPVFDYMVNQSRTRQLRQQDLRAYTGILRTLQQTSLRAFPQAA